MDAVENLAHQVVLLAISPRSGLVPRRGRLEAATAAAALAELALQERVRLSGRLVRVCDSRPTEDPLVDTMLGDLARRPERDPVRIIGDSRRAYLRQAVGELVSNRWVETSLGAGRGGPHYRVLDAHRLQSAADLAAVGLRDPGRAPRRAALLAGLLTEQWLGLPLAPEPKPIRWLSARGELRERLWVIKALHRVYSMSVQLERL